jgi:uncharacterized RDD family membrane protein YckC
MEDMNTPAQTATLQPVYAGFWRRVTAYLIDLTLVKVAFMPFTLLFLRNSGLWDLINISRKLPKEATDMIGLMDPNYALLVQNMFKEISYFFLFHFFFNLLYYSLWESSKLQATPGKLATGIKVTNAEGARVSFVKALERNFFKIISSIALGIGYMMAGWTERKQALHDIMSNCLVSRSETVHEPIKMHAYAGFWRRFIAYVLDSILLYIFLSPINFLFGAKITMRQLLHTIRHTDVPLPGVHELIQLIIVSTVGSLITFFYFASWESSRYQATPGKLALGIKVIDLSGNRLSFWRASGRYVSKFISGYTLLIGYLMAGWTKHKQALHDELAHSLVIIGDNK